VNTLTAEKIYRHFLDREISDEEIAEIQKHFLADNHEIWYKHQERFYDGEERFIDSRKECSDKNIRQAPNHKIVSSHWKEISERLQVDLETASRDWGSKASELMQGLRAVNREKYNYAEFLKRFSVLGEVMQINDEEFDNIFYTYGLSLFGNMPLIEPMEFKDVKRVKEFVIAIDTSGSCSGEIVQAFVQKTYNIMMQTENFFSKINLRIIQCDTEIQDDTIINSTKDFDEYLNSMTLSGFGGTDFRPVFEHIDYLIHEKVFTNLKGMIYFTDGYGSFPLKKPNYEVAFVFLDEEYNNPVVPAWAIKMVLSKDDI